MKIEVHMLNVKDGDAIIIELSKNDKNLVIVVDSGHTGSYARTLKPKLVEILAKHDKNAPDVVVCTHYDSDHIAGLIPLLQDYMDGITQVWVHKTPEVILEHIRQAKQLLLESKSSKSQETLAEQFLSTLKLSDQDLEQNNAEHIILESLPELQILLNLIPIGKRRHTFSGDVPLKDWPEIKILGPTEDYFDSLFPAHQTLKEFLEEEAGLGVEHSRKFERIQELAGISVCDTLKDDTSASITATNKASIVFSIDNENGRYLFTGDAGIESFKKIPNWKVELKELFFLKIPHHGSNNNLSKEIINVMQPKYAYNSGNNHQDENVLQCINSKNRSIEVKSTKISGNLHFDK